MKKIQFSPTQYILVVVLVRFASSHQIVTIRSGGGRLVHGILERALLHAIRLHVLRGDHGQPVEALGFFLLRLPAELQLQLR